MFGLNIERVSSWLAELELDLHLPLHFERVGHGQSNLTYLVRDSAGHRWVLRRPPLGELALTAHDMTREHRILSALAGTSVPTPRVFGLCTDVRVTDVPLLVMEHVEGLIIDQMSVAHSVAPVGRERMGHSMARALGSVQAVDLAKTALCSLASHEPYAERQLRRWQRQHKAIDGPHRPDLDALGARLRAAIPDQEATTLVHGDFHIQNVIVDPVSYEVRAILDWELCTLGDPIADLGGMLANWPQVGDSAPAAFPAATLAGFPSRDELAETYAVETGRALDSLPFWHAFGLWKIAIIAEGVLERSRRHPENAAPVASEQAIDDLVVRGHAVASAAGL